MSKYLPQPCCTDDIFFLSNTQRKQLGIDVNIDTVIDSVIKKVHEGEKPSKAESRSIIQEQYAQLREAVKEGYGNLSFEVQFGGVNFTMSKNLQTNVAVFSAFKKHDMMRELVKLLRDDTGALKSYNDYRKEALPLVKDYRERWLQTEYDTAVRGSRMATVWENLQKTKRLYPNIKYIISRSANKREDHLVLVGTILPIEHPFWLKNFPPNGYGCKCSAKPTDEKPTEEPPHPDINEAFAFNPGIKGKVFDVKKHPYAQLPQKDYEKALYEAHGAACRYETKQFMNTTAEKLKSKPVPVRINQQIQKVEFVASSFKHNLGTGPSYLDKLNLLTNVREHLEEAYWVMEEPNAKPEKKPYAKKYHTLKVSGKEVYLIIEERHDGKFIFHMVKLNDRK